ncbi:MAG: hypothetical protein JNL74_07725, partial [Fibrobacteres bacterium]|nr:hypothetical protein [Fibrobacterota bacterium]
MKVVILSVSVFVLLSFCSKQSKVTIRSIVSHHYPIQMGNSWTYFTKVIIDSSGKTVSVDSFDVSETIVDTLRFKSKLLYVSKYVWRGFGQNKIVGFDSTGNYSNGIDTTILPLHYPVCFPSKPSLGLSWQDTNSRTYSNDK